MTLRGRPRPRFGDGRSGVTAAGSSGCVNTSMTCRILTGIRVLTNVVDVRELRVIHPERVLLLQRMLSTESPRQAQVLDAVSGRRSWFQCYIKER